MHVASGRDVPAKRRPHGRRARRHHAPPIGLVGKDDLQPGREGRRVGPVHDAVSSNPFCNGVILSGAKRSRKI